MIDFKSLGITTADIKQFNRYQRSLFFSKADIPLADLELRNSQKIKNQSLETAPIGIICQNLLGIFPNSISLCKQGTLHRVYLVKTRSKSYIIRVNIWNNLFKELNFFIENWVVAKLNKKALMHIKIKTVDVSRSKVPFDFQIIETAEGKSLYELSQSNGLNNNLFHDLGRLVGRIHDIRTKGYGPFNIVNIIKFKKAVGVYSEWHEYLLKNLTAHLNICLKTAAIDETDYQETLAIFRANKHLFTNIKPSLLHGDIANHNAFTNGRKITALIDWEDCLSGDPIFDIAYWGTGSFLHEQWLEAFISGYQKSQNLPRDFELRYWIYFLRIAIAKNVVRYRFNLDKGKNSPFHPRIKKAIAQLKSLRGEVDKLCFLQ